MRAKFDRSHFIKPVVSFEGDSDCGSQVLPTGELATLVIATHDDIAGAGIEALLQASGHKVVAHCLCEDELLRSLNNHHPDIVLLAESVVQHEAAKTVSELRAHSTSGSIIFLLEERGAIMAADLLELDVDGILLSGARASILIDCVQSVFRGRKWLDPDLLHHLATAERSSLKTSSLTLREADIVHLILRGLRNKEIASKLRLSEGTVKMHLHHIYGKLRVGGRTQLAMSMAGARAGMPESGNEARREWGPTISDPATAARLQRKN
ncbi:response regulator transcription factor [Bradyrhizobium cosmicum]|uniref:response regulator transcription factor n=1 Tax=Bradyrhizobium cosmicum TaxID=1404864 RepID=UPI0028E58BC2|nr:response regulator transcription factor [Bradyrhizobium cosmicum]